MLNVGAVFTSFLALFAFSSIPLATIPLATIPLATIPIETDPIKGVILSIDDLYNDTFIVWDTILAVSNKLNITSYIYITEYTKEKNIIDLYYRKYKNIILINDYHTNTIWMRDYGPIFYRNNHGDLNILKIHYKHHRKYDNLVPYDFSYRFNIPITKLDIIMEGGNFITNGNGICIVSDKVLEYNYDIGILKHYGCWKNLIIVKSLARDGTRHVDMWLTWINKNTLFAGLYSKEQDIENHNIMSRNIDYIKSLIDLEIIILPMPNRGHRDLTKSYINALIMNDHVILPVYEDKTWEKEAIAIWQKYFKYIHPIYAESLIKYDGAIHCIARTIPI